MAKPTTPAALKGKVAVSKDSGINIAGYLTWFSIPDDSVPLRRLKQHLAVNGLPMSLAPKDTSPIHIFKRAMREQEGRHKLESGLIRENTVAQVVETPDDCVYQISSLKRDLEERVVEYPKAMRVIFNKKTEQIGFNPLGGVPRSELLDMMEAIQDFYDKNGTRVTGARVRTVVRNYLRDEEDEKREIEGLSGINLRGKAGGIYFVLARYLVQLEAVGVMLDELYGGRAYLHFVPMADGASEKEIIRRHHVANARQELKEAIAEVKGLLSHDRERAPRSDVVAAKFAQFQALQRRAAKYNEVLDDEIAEIEDMGAILKKQLDKLGG